MRHISAIYLGHSHLAALAPALRNREEQANLSGPPIKHFIFNTSKYNIFGSGPDKFHFAETIENSNRLNKDLLRMINETIPADSEVVIITMFGGNTHNAITMLEVPGGIDVVLPNNEDLPIDKEANVIPYNLLKEILTEQCKEYLAALQSTRNASTGKIFHVVSPPPIKDDYYLSSVVNRDPYFSQLGHNRVTPAITRYKMWLTHTEVYRSVCEKYDIQLLYPPDDCIIEGRWLSPDCIGLDPTHGNNIYAERVLKQIEVTIGGHFAGWSWLG